MPEVGMVPPPREGAGQVRPDVLPEPVLSAHLFELFASTTLDTVYLYDVRSRRVAYMNRSVPEQIGYPPSDEPEAQFFELLHPEDRPRFEAAAPRMRRLADGELATEIFRMLGPDGEWRWIVLRNSVAQRDADGQVLSVFGHAYDDTERRARQAQVEEALHLLHSVGQATPDDIWVYDIPTERFVYTTERTLLDMGFTPPDPVSIDPRLLLDRLHPDDRDDFYWTVALVAANSETDDAVVEVPYRMDDGEGGWRRHRARFSVLRRDETGAAVRILGMDRDVTDEEHREAALREALVFTEAITLTTPDIISVYDLTKSGNVYRNVPLHRHLGYSADQLGNFNDFLWDVCHPEDKSKIPWLRRAVIKLADGEVLETAGRLRAADGSWRWMSGRHVVFARNDAGEVTQILTSVRDHTPEFDTQRRLLRSEARFRGFAEAAPLGITVTTADDRWILANPAFCRFVGRSEEDLRAARMRDLFHPEDLPAVNSDRQRLTSGQTPSFVAERRFLTTDGELRYGLTSAVMMPLDDGTPAVLAYVQDITARKRMESELEHAALHDALTRLPNRTLLNARLEAALARSRASQRRVAVMFIDLDNFKTVNDSMGHSAGDELLRTVAERLVSALRPADTASRLGGDEFVVVCEAVSEESEARTVAERIRAAIAEPMALQGQEIVVTSSVGVAISGSSDLAEPDATGERLMRDADAAMYLAKQRGRACVVLAEQGMHASAQRQLRLDAALRRAVTNEELALRYQPVVRADGRIYGAEALVRWHSPDSGEQLPESFMDVAESSDLITLIGSWVLERACQEAASWPVLPDGGLPQLTINVAARQLAHGRFSDEVEKALSSTGMSADRLVVEITESQLIHATQGALADLRLLNEMGVSVAVDDFGTGFAPLTYLKQLPAQIVKIDRTFVAGLGSDATDEAIVEAVISLAHATDRRVVAEGVETQGQFDRLAELGCDFMQGYLLHRPMTADEMRGVLTVGRWTP